MKAFAERISRGIMSQKARRDRRILLTQNDGAHRIFSASIVISICFKEHMFRTPLDIVGPSLIYFLPRLALFVCIQVATRLLE